MAIGNFVTAEEAAKELGVSKRRVHQFIEKGRLSVAARIGGCSLLDVREVRKFARTKRKPGRPSGQIKILRTV